MFSKPINGLGEVDAAVDVAVGVAVDLAVDVVVDVAIDINVVKATNTGKEVVMIEYMVVLVRKAIWFNLISS